MKDKIKDYENVCKNCFKPFEPTECPVCIEKRTRRKMLEELKKKMPKEKRWPGKKRVSTNAIMEVGFNQALSEITKIIDDLMK